MGWDAMQENENLELERASEERGSERIRQVPTVSETNWAERKEIPSSGNGWHALERLLRLTATKLCFVQYMPLASTATDGSRRTATSRRLGSGSGRRQLDWTARYKNNYIGVRGLVDCTCTMHEGKTFLSLACPGLLSSLLSPLSSHIHIHMAWPPLPPPNADQISLADSDLI
jgi:hypothetical protein